jgi:hypothetical protein
VCIVCEGLPDSMPMMAPTLALMPIFSFEWIRVLPRIVMSDKSSVQNDKSKIGQMLFTNVVDKIVQKFVEKLFKSLLKRRREKISSENIVNRASTICAVCS